MRNQREDSCERMLWGTGGKKVGSGASARGLVGSGERRSVFHPAGSMDAA